jgi:hypothetical protein
MVKVRMNFCRQVAEHVQPFDAVTLVYVTCDAAACTCDQFEQGDIRNSHVRRKHRFDLVVRPHPINDGKGGIECYFIGTTRKKFVILRMVLGRLP